MSAGAGAPPASTTSRPEGSAPHDSATGGRVPENYVPDNHVIVMFGATGNLASVTT